MSRITNCIWNATLGETQRAKIHPLPLGEGAKPVIDRPYSSGINTVGAVYDRATSVRKSFETETSYSYLP